MFALAGTTAVVSEVAYMLLLFVGVIVITAVAFGVWLIVAIIRLILRGMGAIFSPPRTYRPVSVATFCCPRRGCQAINPVSARFCRRCGQELLHGHAANRQAAVW